MDLVEWTIFFSARLLSGDRMRRRPVAVKDSGEVAAVNSLVLVRRCNGKTLRCAHLSAAYPHPDPGIYCDGVPFGNIQNSIFPQSAS
jgi:hypothetical protein